jgi:NO-binding membrane sensor protein with MHYT domain
VAAGCGTVNDFTYGVISPLAAFVMACLGSALGLRCTVRALSMDPSRRAGWLALGAIAIGSGIWTMHFVAMIGFSVTDVKIDYDKPITFASLLVVIAVVGIGVFVVGVLGRGPLPLLLGGTVTGFGVATMHYLGMAGMRLRADFQYDAVTAAASVAIAVLVSTAALWCAVSIKGAYTGLGAGLIMGVAVSGMHYAGMAALRVHIQGFDSGAVDSGTAAAALAPLLIGPVVFLFLAGVVVALDPLSAQPLPRHDLPGPAGVPDPAKPSAAWQATRSPAERRPPEPW